MFLEKLIIVLFFVLCIFLNNRYKKKTAEELERVVKNSSIFFILLLPIALFGMLFSGDSPYVNSTILAISMFLFVDGIPFAILITSSFQYEQKKKRLEHQNLK